MGVPAPVVARVGRAPVLGGGREVGEVRVAVYLIGNTRSGPSWAGLKTVSVET